MNVVFLKYICMQYKILCTNCQLLSVIFEILDVVMLPSSYNVLPGIIKNFNMSIGVTKTNLKSKNFNELTSIEGKKIALLMCLGLKMYL